MVVTVRVNRDDDCRGWGGVSGDDLKGESW